MLSNKLNYTANTTNSNNNQTNSSGSTVTQGNENLTTETAEAISQLEQEQFLAHDQRVMKVETGYATGADPTLPDREDTMGTEDIDHKQLLKQPLVTNAFSWGVDSGRGTILATYQVPAIFSQVKTYHRRILELYAFTKFKLQLHIRLNTTKFHSGKLIVWWDPMDMSTPLAQFSSPHRQLDVYRASGQPNVLLDCGDSNPGIIEIPWEHYISYINLTDNSAVSNQFGTVYVMVLNTLKATSSVSQAVGVNVMLSVSDIELRLPVRPHELQVEEYLSAEPHFFKELFTEGGGLIGDVIGTATNFVTGNFSKAASSAGSGFGRLGKLLGIFNLDKPSNPDARVDNMLSSAAPLAHMKGIDNAVRLGATPIAGYLETDFSNAPPEELQISNIIQTKMIFDIFTWSTNQPQNTVINTYPVRPGLTGSNTGVFTPPGIQNECYIESPTYLSYMEKLFDQWSGSMVFRFDFAASQFHSGRLQFSFEPSFNTIPLEPDDAVLAYSQLPNIVFDLRESKSITFYVPYVSEFKRLFTSAQYANTQLDTITRALGQLRITVLDPLVTSDNVAQEVEINAYVCAGPDFQFEVPRISSGNNLLTMDLVKVLIPVTVEPHMAMDDVKTRSEDKETGPAITKGNRLKPPSDVYNESIRSVLDLVRRYTKLTEKALIFDSSAITPFPQIASGYKKVTSTLPVRPMPDNGFVSFENMDYLPMSQQYVSYVSQLYAFWSGSMRYKFMPCTDRTKPIIYEAYNALRNKVFNEQSTNLLDVVTNAYPSTVQANAQDTTVEVEVPYFHVFNQCLTGPEVNVSTNLVDTPYQSATLFVSRSVANVDALPKTNNDPYLPERLYISAGDDFMLRYLIAPPNIYRVVPIPNL